LGRGDPEEGHSIYNTGTAVGDSEDRDFVKIAARAGIMIGPGCSNVQISNNTNRSVIEDAFVFCTAMHFDPTSMAEEFGKYCVRINKVRRFFERTTRALRADQEIQQAAFGPVIYQSREFFGLQSPPGPIGFVKPPDRYESQREFRLLWTVRGSRQIKPRLLEVPEISSLCERVA
jgi:hypothetical protein